MFPSPSSISPQPHFARAIPANINFINIIANHVVLQFLEFLSIYIFLSILRVQAHIRVWVGDGNQMRFDADVIGNGSEQVQPN